MPTFTRPDGTIEGKYLSVEYHDGTRVEASDQEFDLKQNGRSISILCGPKLFRDIMSSGKQPEQILYAVISSPDLQELARVVIEQCLMMRSEGHPPMMLEGHIMDE